MPEPEAAARKKIDELLLASGWKVQDYKDIDLSSGPGVAVREVPLKAGTADYLLFVNRKAVGVLEAKPAGTPLNAGKYIPATGTYTNGNRREVYAL